MFVVSCFTFVVRCGLMLFIVCRALRAARCPLFFVVLFCVACCWLFVCCCVVRCLLFVDCCVVFVVCRSSFVVRRVSRVVCWFVVAFVFVVCWLC